MQKLKALITVVGIAQIVLGLLFLFSPHELLHWMGHSSIADDLVYPLGMLAARFLVYGVLMLLASRNPSDHKPLILGMMWIQIIDLAVGIFYTAQGSVTLSLSAFPMFNATLIAGLLWRWQPSQRTAL